MPRRSWFARATDGELADYVGDLKGYTVQEWREWFLAKHATSMRPKSEAAGSDASRPAAEETAIVDVVPAAKRRRTDEDESVVVEVNEEEVEADESAASSSSRQPSLEYQAAAAAVAAAWEQVEELKALWELRRK